VLKTLRIQSSVTAVRLIASSSAVVLFEFFDCLDDVVEVRPVAGFEFRMEQFAIGANLESAAARGNQRERFNALAELKNFRRQTDGFRRVVSNDAVFDRDFGFHRQTPFQNETNRRDRSGSRSTNPTMTQGCETLQKCNLCNP